MERILEPEAMDDAREANAYDTMDHFEPNEAFTERLVELGAMGRMLDVGTGPGHIPPMVCGRIPGSRVLGVDLSCPMLTLAIHHAAAACLQDRIAYQCADARRLPFGSNAFDVVFSNTILHHLSDPRPVLLEICRVVRPGGTVLIRDLFRPPSRRRTEQLVRQHATDATTPQQSMFFASLCAAFTPEEIRNMLGGMHLAELCVVIDSDRHMSIQTAR